MFSGKCLSELGPSKYNGFQVLEGNALGERVGKMDVHPGRIMEK